jgi:hypothetical protein
VNRGGPGVFFSKEGTRTFAAPLQEPPVGFEPTASRLQIGRTSSRAGAACGTGGPVRTSSPRPWPPPSQGRCLLTVNRADQVSLPISHPGYEAGRPGVEPGVTRTRHIGQLDQSAGNQGGTGDNARALPVELPLYEYREEDSNLQPLASEGSRSCASADLLSGEGESNPRRQLGRLEHGRSVTTA